MNQSESPPVIKQQTRVVKFNFSLFDLIKCRLWVMHHNKFLMGLYFVCCLFIASMGLSDNKLVEHPVGFRIFTFIITAIMALIFLGIFNIVLQIIRTVSAKNRGLVGAHQIEAGEEYITETTDFNAATFRWSGFHKMRESANYLFLYVAENNVLYVPKNSFSSVQEASEFKEFILRKTRKL